MAVEVEGRKIGGDTPALLIAELSANHDRDLDQALALVDIAADAGWDCERSGIGSSQNSWC